MDFVTDLPHCKTKRFCGSLLQVIMPHTKVLPCIWVFWHPRGYYGWLESPVDNSSLGKFHEQAGWLSDIGVPPVKGLVERANIKTIVLPWAEYTQNSLNQIYTKLKPFRCILGNHICSPGMQTLWIHWQCTAGSREVNSYGNRHINT